MQLLNRALRQYAPATLGIAAADGVLIADIGFTSIIRSAAPGWSVLAAPTLPLALAVAAGTLSSLVNTNYQHENEGNKSHAHVCSSEVPVPGADLCSD